MKEMVTETIRVKNEPWHKGEPEEKWDHQDLKQHIKKFNDRSLHPMLRNLDPDHKGNACVNLEFVCFHKNLEDIAGFKGENFEENILEEMGP